MAISLLRSEKGSARSVGFESANGQSGLLTEPRLDPPTFKVTGCPGQGLASPTMWSPLCVSSLAPATPYVPVALSFLAASKHAVPSDNPAPGLTSPQLFPESCLPASG